MAIVTEEITYQCQGQDHHALIARDDSWANQHPTVLIAHDWTGRNTFAIEKAKQLAGLGYVGIALDNYGEGRQGADNDEKMALMQPMIENRRLLRDRMLAGFEMAKAQTSVNPEKIAAMGYCFGGLCVLDLARAGAQVTGVVSFHGLLFPPENLPSETIHAKVLALHGYDDPMVKPDAMLAFCDEMTAAGVDWQCHSYGGTLHAFTNPEANDPGFGTVYNAAAAERAWQSLVNFLAEIF